MTFDLGYFIKQRKPAPLPLVTSVGGVVSYETVNGVNYKIHTFLTSDTFTAFSRLSGTSTVSLQYLTVAGGGGGGWSVTNSGAGGGGAGGVLTGTNFVINVGQVYPIIIGAGGSGIKGSTTNGGNTESFGIIPVGGGRGGGALPGSPPLSGGSGGGADGGGSTSVGIGTVGQGNNGGSGGTGTSGQQGAGGGGGAGAAGGNRSGGTAGAGGIGIINPILSSRVGQITTATNDGSVLITNTVGSENYISLPSADAVLLLDTDFTYEFFAQRLINSSISCIATTSQQGVPVLRFEQTFMTTLFGRIDYGTTTNTNATLFAAPGVWFHAAFTRSGTGENNCSVYINGARIAQFTNNQPFNFGGGFNRIGSDNVGINREWPGYISNLRIIKGTAFYNIPNFSVPTGKLLALAGTSFLGFTSPTVINDISTNNFSLTINGIPSAGYTSPFSATLPIRYIGGGGGGGASNSGGSNGGAGGFGGGGAGGTAGTDLTAQSGLVNSGGGGGGAGQNFATNTNRGGNGGSGVVVIRFQI